jgi:hypothetical protein
VETDRDDRFDELMRADQERWARIESATTPEELTRALREEAPSESPADVEPTPPAPPPKRSFSFTPTIVSIAFGVAVMLAWSLWVQSILSNAP